MVGSSDTNRCDTILDVTDLGAKVVLEVTGSVESLNRSLATETWVCVGGGGGMKM